MTAKRPLTTPSLLSVHRKTLALTVTTVRWQALD
jgi:hypothetical protein